MRLSKRSAAGVLSAPWWPGIAVRGLTVSPVWRRRILAILLPAFILLAWAMAARLAWVSPQVLPAPGAVLATLAELFASGELADNIRVSLFRIGVGFAGGAALGLALGACLAFSATVRAYLEPTLRSLFAVPTIGWIPILILIFGIEETLKLLIIAKAVTVPVTLHTADAIGRTPPRFLELADVLGLRGWARLRYVTGPPALPVICNGLRLGLSSAFIALVVVEMLAATEGLGYMMVWGRTLFQLDVVIAGIILVGVVGFVLDRVLSHGMSRLRRGGYGVG
ncbi:MAG: ABC transporter permease [Pigmentiphaga sp.]|nr:ABC transporter permease [Pigmentiphaga sp.]